jgi:hypothetical protein
MMAGGAVILDRLRYVRPVFVLYSIYSKLRWLVSRLVVRCRIGPHEQRAPAVCANAMQT